MNILVGCEISGRVRDAFRDRGHNAWSCDLLGPDDQEWWLFPDQRHPQFHIVGDVLDVLERGDWDMLIAFPPCRYLSRAGLHLTHKVPGREAETEKALDFVRRLFAAKVKRRCIENPRGAISRIRKPTQTIHPWWFGADASKGTCLWLDGLPPLVPTNPLVKEQYANRSASGQDLTQPSRLRPLLRAVTDPLVAEAMAQQWSST